MLAGGALFTTAEWGSDEVVVQSAQLPGLGSILSTIYVRIRVIGLANTVFVDTIPDYQHEIPALSGQNRIAIEAD